jgi:hypothetical protein
VIQARQEDLPMSDQFWLINQLPAIERTGAFAM